MSAGSPSPQGCTHFKLRQLVRSVARLYDAEIAEAGLKGTQFSLLSHVAAFGPITPTELAERMGLDASTLTRNLRPLVEQGWVIQGPGVNARERLVRITPEGSAKHAEAKLCWKRAQQALNRTLGNDSVVELHAMIDRAQGLLRAAERESGVA